MARFTVEFTVDLDGAGRELRRLATTAPVLELERALLETFAVTERRVHRITGRLLASGRPSSDFTGDEWTGTISYARYPGIYELARGQDTPTRHHPEGGHFFFDPVEADWPGDWTTGDAYHLYTGIMEDHLKGWNFHH